ncbi:PucR family transcriptional regulator [Cryobacterium mannosilyticum]|uniref:PucR family transcriptional regulator n=1 Tax=Cryobacterium mannosilyticum TaxID=1259190 RepID=A0A4R8W780_9MICO|nr:PucR family transcriptional regulator [Cryobacterium mannosilyticum]TFC03653.1 PucR family transcriptional regulator [Cryobacterium mannosilyticum]
MTLDVAAVARLVNATLVVRGAASNSQVDDVILLDQFSVVARTDFVSLVLATDVQFAALMGDESDRIDFLQGSVLITPTPRIPRNALVRIIEAMGLTVLFCESTDLDRVRLEIALSLATDRAAEARLVTTGTKVLTQVARRGGANAVVVELAQRLNGWVVLLDKAGQAITSAGAGALHLDDAVAVAFQRPVRVSHPGLQVHPIGEGEELRAFLVVASRSGTTSRTRDLAAQSAALIDILLRTHDHTETERLGREVMMASLLAVPANSPAQLLRRWGVRDASMTGFILSSRTKSVDVERLILRWLDEMGTVHAVSPERDRTVGLIRDDLVTELARRVDNFVAEAQTPLRCGIGSSAALDALNITVGEAREAHDIAVASNCSTVRYETLPTVQYLIGALDSQAIARIVRIVDGLRNPDGTPGELMETLRTYLAEHGALGITARRLGIHRHTLTNRIAQIEKRTGLSMENPDDRAAAWLAMRALGHPTS